MDTSNSERPFSEAWWDKMLMEANWRQEIAMYNRKTEDEERYGNLFEWIEERIAKANGN